MEDPGRAPGSTGGLPRRAVASQNSNIQENLYEEIVGTREASPLSAQTPSQKSGSQENNA